mgnify:CR=1 FL=1
MDKQYNEIAFPKSLIAQDFLENGFTNKDSLQWFLNIKESRLEYLFKYVFDTNKIEFTQKHIQSLFYFLKENLYIKDKTEKEIQENIKLVPEHLKKIHKIEKYFIVEPSISIIFDIAVFFGEYLIKEVENTYWHFLDIEDRVGANRPIIMKKDSNIECNPLWLLRILSKQLIEKDVNEDRMLNLFTMWKNALVKG